MGIRNDIPSNSESVRLMGWYGGSCNCDCSQYDPDIYCETTNPLSTIVLNDSFDSDCLSSDATHGYFGVGGPCSLTPPQINYGDQSGDDLVDCYSGFRVASINGHIGSLAPMVLGPHKYKMSVANGTLEAGTLSASGSVKVGHERFANTVDSGGDQTAPTTIKMTVLICGITIECKSIKTGTFSGISTYYTTTLTISKGAFSDTTSGTTSLNTFRGTMATFSWSINQTAAAYIDSGNDVADFTITITGGGQTVTLTDQMLPIDWCNHDNYMEVQNNGSVSRINPSSGSVDTSKGISYDDAASITDLSYKLVFPKIDDFEFEVIET